MGVPRLSGMETQNKSLQSPGGRIRSVHPIMSAAKGRNGALVYKHTGGLAVNLKTALIYAA